MLSGGIIYELYEYVPLAQLDRASDYGSEGREFESSAARQKKTAIFLKKVVVFFCSVLLHLFSALYSLKENCRFLIKDKEEEIRKSVSL